MVSLLEKTSQEVVNEMVHDGWNKKYSLQQALNLWLGETNLIKYSVQQALSLIIYGRKWRGESEQEMLKDFFDDSLWKNRYSVQQWFNLIITFLPQDNLIFNSNYSESTGQITDRIGNNVSVYYPDLTDNGDGTWTIGTNYSLDNGYIGVPFNYIDETTIAFVEYFGEVDPVIFTDGSWSFTAGDVDTQGNAIVDYQGENAIAPYCIIKFDSSLPIFDDENEDIWNADLQIFNLAQNYTYNEGIDTFDNFAWQVSVLTRGNEFLRSLNVLGWMLFVQIDRNVQKIVGYNLNTFIAKISTPFATQRITFDGGTL